MTKWEEMTPREQVQLILERAMGYFILGQASENGMTPGHPRGEEAADKGFHWPIAFWNTSSECWMTRDIATEPAFFDPLHDLNDAWLIMDHLKPGRSGLTTKEDHETFLVRARFVDTLDNMTSWWSWPADRLCLSICRAALNAVGWKESDDE